MFINSFTSFVQDRTMGTSRVQDCSARVSCLSCVSAGTRRPGISLARTQTSVLAHGPAAALRSCVASTASIVVCPREECRSYAACAGFRRVRYTPRRMTSVLTVQSGGDYHGFRFRGRNHL